MGIEPHAKSNASPEDREVLRKVYADQLRDLRPRLEAAKRKQEETSRALIEADEANAKATHEAGWLQGQVDAIVLLAKRDGIDLTE